MQVFNNGVSLKINGTYFNAKGQHVVIVREVSQHDLHHEKGFRFIDKHGNYYTENGRYDVQLDASPFNLIGEYEPSSSPQDRVTRKVTETITQPEGQGMGSRIWNRIRANPVKSTLVIGGVGGAAALGAYNYKETGSVTGSAGNDEVVVEAARVAMAIASRF